MPGKGEQRLGLVVLDETGETRGGIPVFRYSAAQARVAGILSRGFSGRWVHLFGYEQEYLRKKGGPAPEPAYLLLSSKQGGFPRFGFYLGTEDKRSAGYVDLPRDQALAGRFGAVDQIFPHELAHVIVRELAGARGPTWANQIHAIGVRTDPVVAFDEGFAEHFQVMAIEDPDANPATRALARDAESLRLAYHRLSGYRHELSARWAFATRWRMTFPLWFSGTEQLLRYEAVKANAFAIEPAVPDRLLILADPYSAYLLENILPGSVGGRPKSVARRLSTEGVVSTLFYRWANSPPLRDHYLPEAFYAQFGATRAEVTPLENLYLKLFDVFYTYKPQDTVQVLLAYRTAFPEEAADLDAVVSGVLLGQPLQRAPAVWLANPDFRTGTTVFDQFRGTPRIHTFDLNAASSVDLLGVPGVSRALAQSILEGAPYANVEDLHRVPGITPDLLDRFRHMAVKMRELHLDRDQMEAEVSVQAILMPYLWRAVACLLLASMLGAALYRLVRTVRLVRLVANGLGAAFVGLLASWLVGGNGLLPILAPLLLFGFPGAAWHLWRHRGWRSALRVLLAWAVAATPAAVLSRPWF